MRHGKPYILYTGVGTSPRQYMERGRYTPASAFTHILVIYSYVHVIIVVLVRRGLCSVVFLINNHRRHISMVVYIFLRWPKRRHGFFRVCPAPANHEQCQLGRGTRLPFADMAVDVASPRWGTEVLVDFQG